MRIIEVMGHREVLPLKNPERVLSPSRNYRNKISKLIPLLGIGLLGAALYASCVSSLHFPKPAFSILTNKLCHFHNTKHCTEARLQKFQELCPLVEPIWPSIDNPSLAEALSHLRSPEYLSFSARILGDAVGIPTSVYDDFGDVYKDKRWSRMEEFTRWLRDSFPLVNEHMKLEMINKYGVLYTLEGSDSKLKPVLLAAHQDVVPVDDSTIDDWEYPPYSGKFDGESVWGRGSIDDKNQLVAIMEAMELLFRGEFRPRRTVILAFGFDEEIGGGQGAHYLGEVLEERYGRGGIALIIDEGSAGARQFDANFMVISTAEKGFLNQKITIKMPGGHSSVPPHHTSIGIISRLAVALEDDPFEIHFSDDNPLYDFLTCAAAHAENFPREGIDLIEQGDKQALAHWLVKYNSRYEVDLRTTTAITMIKGGDKINALPEFVTLGINHRIRRGSNTKEVTKATIKHASKLAQKFNLTLISYPDPARVERYPESSITLEIDYAREPSPLTSSRTDVLTPFKLIAGTTRAVFQRDLIVTAGLNMGNTDTYWYTGLSENIFRYAPMPVVKVGLHDVNEHVPIKGHILMVEWFFAFLLNVDAVDETSAW